MPSPEYTTLMKQLTRYRLSGLVPGARAMERGIEYEIETIKYIIDQNELGAKVCQELLDEFQKPQKQDEVSRPLRGLFVKADLSAGDASGEPELLDAMKETWAHGKNLLVQGSSDDRKEKLIMSAAKQYMEENSRYKEMYLLSRKCSKKTSEMELCCECRRYIDNRIQLGYLAEGMLLAKEHPDALVMLVLSEADTVDLVHILSQFWKLLEQKGRDQMISYDCTLTNPSNFLFCVTENMENENRNVNMDNPVVQQLFRTVNIWNPEMVKQARHRMV